ncbi:RNA polymerase sigma factor, partial [Enterococcus faecalis]|uniref:RNA polymerase sigma factor n=1 Tax=Enterococcus faecalis TaxID=1351 RepID=UPI00403F2BF1
SEICFAALVERYEARIMGFVLRRCASASDAEDATQDTFVRAWRMLHRYDPSRRFSPWLFTLAARAAQEANRGASRRARHEAESARLSRPEP